MNNMKYTDWEKSIPMQIAADPLWQVKAYRYGLFLCDLGWHDVTKLLQDRRTISLADQLYRALGSVPANIAEGYSRGSGKDRVRFYEYSLGSARESRGWIYAGRHVVTENVAFHRIQLLTEISKLLLKMIPDQRDESFKEEAVAYHAEHLILSDLGTCVNVDELLENVPLP